MGVVGIFPRGGHIVPAQGISFSEPSSNDLGRRHHRQNVNSSPPSSLHSLFSALE